MTKGDSAGRARSVLTDAEVKALARRLMSRIAWDWPRLLSWEDVPLLAEQDWTRLSDALDREAVALTARAKNADEVEDIDSVYLWERTQ